MTRRYLRLLIAGVAMLLFFSFFGVTAVKAEDTTDSTVVAGTASDSTKNTGSDKNAPHIVQLTNPIGDNPDVQEILGRIISTAMGVLGALALLVFVYGGFKWLTAAGNEEHVKEGTQAMMWAVIGIFIIFGSYAIIKLVYTGLGIDAGSKEKPANGSEIVWCKDDKTNLCSQMKPDECSSFMFKTDEECLNAQNSAK